MKGWIPHRVSVLALALLVPVAAWAVCGRCKWAEREGRFEGVIEQRQYSGGQSCDLLAVQYRAGRGGSPGQGKLLNLYFWLPQPEEVAIEVWEPRSNYWMVPKDRRFPQGRQVFSWPRSEVVEPLGLSPEALYAKVRDVAGRLYFPAVLSAGDKPALLGGYDFVLESAAGLDVACTISRQEGGKLVPVASFPHTEDDPGIFHLDWNGRDAKGNPAPEGVYVLRLKGDLLAERISPLDRDFSFWHGGSLQ